MQVPFALKRWQSEGRIAGPRVFPAGQLIVGRGGHGTEGFGLRTAPDYAQAAVREASGPDEWRDAVRIQFKQGADIIKLASHYSQVEIDAAVEEAHALGLPVTVDAETQYIDRAIQAGVDCVEHPLPRSDRAIELMAKNGIASVPTLVPYRYINRLGGGTHRVHDDRGLEDADRRACRAGDIRCSWSVFLPVSSDTAYRHVPTICYSTVASAPVARGNG